MLNESCNEFHCGNGFSDKFVIFVAVIMKGYVITIVIINARGGNDRSAKITTDIFGNRLRVAFVRFCIDIKSLSMLAVTSGLNLFEGWTEVFFQEIKKCGSKSIAEIGIVKMSFGTP